MIKNAILYRIIGGSIPSAVDLDTALRQYAHRAPGPLEERTSGFVPVVGNVYCHEANGLKCLKAITEKKVIPAFAVAQRVKQYERDLAEPISRAQRRDVVRQIRDELLSSALTTATTNMVLIDIKRGWLIVDAASPSRSDELISLLRGLFDTPWPHIKPVYNKLGSLSLLLVDWANSGPPLGFTLSGDMQWDDGGDSVIRCKGEIRNDDLRAIQQGRVITHLRVTHLDRVSVTILADGLLRSIKFDIVPDETEYDDDASMFDADFAVKGTVFMELLDKLSEQWTPHQAVSGRSMH